MGVGQLSESDAVDDLRLPFYSSSHPTGSHGWRIQFDLGNPDYRSIIFPDLLTTDIIVDHRHMNTPGGTVLLRPSGPTCLRH